MATHPFKVTIHMVSSLDGIIAKKDNSVSWFETADQYEKGATVSEQDVAEFLKTIDCYVMGSHTYEHALQLSKSYGWAYGDVPTIVLSHRNLLDQVGQEQALHLQDVTAYKNGMVELRYEIKK